MPLSKEMPLSVKHRLSHKEYNRMKKGSFPDFTTGPLDATVQMEFLREAHRVADNLKKGLECFRPLDHRYGELAHVLDVFQGIAEEKITDTFPQ